MKILITVAALFALSSIGNAQSVEWIARKTGNTVKVTRDMLAAGLVYDASDNSLKSPDAVGKHVPRPHFEYWIERKYLRYLDSNGEVHTIVTDMVRYDPVSQIQWFRNAVTGEWIQW